MSENTLLMAMILGQSLLIVIALGMIFYFGFKFQRLSKSEKLFTKKDSDTSSVKKLKEENSKASPSSENLTVGMCDTHPANRANGSCAICEKLLCEDCNMMNGKLHFCPEHFSFYNQNNWVEIDRVKTTPDTTEKSGYLFSFKKRNGKSKTYL